MPAPRCAALLALGLGCALVLPGRAAEQEWGTLRGQIVYGGTVKPNQKADLKTHQDRKACLKNGDIIQDDLLVHPDSKGVRWVVVWLAKDDDGTADNTAELPIHPSLKKLGEKAVVMDQPCCKFEPHIVAMRAGQDFIGKNSSGLKHSMRVIGVGPNSGNSLNVVLEPKSERKIGKNEWQATGSPNPIDCTLHPWMKGWLFVFAHPYFAISDENGKFELKNVPAGKFRLVIWHERGGWLVSEKDNKGKNGKLITIGAKESTELGKIEMKD
jgi:hypothetical protein